MNFLPIEMVEQLQALANSDRVSLEDVFERVLNLGLQAYALKERTN